jgi:hypothetical protein
MRRRPHVARRPRRLAYTFAPALGVSEWLKSADAEGRSRLGRRPGDGPPDRAHIDREIQ